MQDNARGALFMVLAMAGFAVEDLLIKLATRGLPAGLVLMLFGLGGCAGFAALARRAGQPLVSPLMLQPVMALKALAEVTGRMGYTLALATTALSTASAIMQATPLVVVAGAALVFGETVGWRRWSAIAVGFAGVVMILRPGLEGFTAGALWAVVSTVGFAARDLATRAAPRGLGNAQLGLTGFSVLVPTGAVIWALGLGAEGDGSHLSTGLALASVCAACCVGIGAYSALTTAMRVGEVSVVTPFRYTRLIFAMILGASLLAERPDALTLAGAALILAAGVYTLLRTRRAGQPVAVRARG
ncbi:DMT family transporter [Frigidibacter sp. MR17.24]|uniref:DMT family transporter n=1 Tax=Frigidibacter sp. MR17.24 TaxID=3127345 RepID=UPI003012D33D